MKNRLTLLSTLMSLSLVSQQTFPQTLGGQRIVAVPIVGNLEISGKLDDSRWNIHPQVHLSYEIQPGENTIAKQRTSVRVLYNDEYLYLGFLCYDTDISQLRAYLTDRDKIFNDDYVGVLIDTYGDNQRAYQLLVNPLGIQADLIKTNATEDDTFDLVWQSKAAVGDSAWTVEIAIPFKSLRFPSKQEQTWNVMFHRSYPRESKSLFSSTPLDRNNPCFLCQGQLLTSLFDLEGTSTFEFLPYALAFQSGSLVDVNNPFSTFNNSSILARGGAGFKYSPAPDLLIEAIVNPDFSQVESDAEQISVNTTFALFYPERRPFFLESSDLFRNRTNIFYSRTINDPIAAGKLSGKTGSLSFAYLTALDRNSTFLIAGEENSDFVPSSLNSLSQIARLRLDLGNESFLGALGTFRNTGSAHNYVAGIDWNYLFLGNNYFRGELFYSHTQEPIDPQLFSTSRLLGSDRNTATFDGETYGGFSARINLIHDGRDFGTNLVLQDRSSTFQAQQGFVIENSFRTVLLEQWHNFYPNDALIDKGLIGFNTGVYFNYDGIRKNRWFFPVLSLDFKSQTNLFALYYLVNDELFRGIQFHDQKRLVASVSSNPFREIYLALNAEVGSFIYRTITPEAGVGHNLGVSTTIKPSEGSQLEFSYSRARLSSEDSTQLFYDGNVFRTVAAYQFSPEFFIRAIAQYNSFDDSLNVYPLLSYKLNPFTIFYIGMTNDSTRFDNLDRFVTTNRQFFAKLQYLLRS